MRPDAESALFISARCDAVRRNVLRIGTALTALLSGCHKDRITGPSCSGSGASATCSFKQPVSPTGGTIALPSGVSVTVPAGGTTKKGEITLVDAPGVNPTTFADPTRKVTVALSNPTATTQDSITMVVSIRLPRAVPSDSIVAVSVEVDGVRYWADVAPGGGAAGTSSATIESNAVGDAVVDVVTLPIKVLWLNQLITIRVIGMARPGFNACADVYRIAPASGLTPTITPLRNIVLIHGIQLTRFCGFEGDAVGLLPFSDYEPEQDWSDLISVIKSSSPFYNVYVARYPSVFSPQTTGPALAIRLGQLNLSNIILVGHSMGGLVARYIAQSLPAGTVKAIATIATPHSGTPVVGIAESHLNPVVPTEGLRSLAPGELTGLQWPAPAPVYTFSGGVKCSENPGSTAQAVVEFFTRAHKQLCGAKYGTPTVLE